MTVTRLIRLVALGILLAGCAAMSPAPAGLQKIEHIVVIFLENRSFDHMFGNFPGANGLGNAGEAAVQVDENDRAYELLPDPLDVRKSPAARYTAIPEKLPNKPFRLNDYYKPSEILGSLVHAFYDQQQQINGGRMNRFAGVSDAKGYTMGYWDASGLRLWDYAKRYTLADNFFHAAFGGSFLNHMWLVCACTPRYPNAPDKIVAHVDGSGKLVRNGFVTPDGYGVNTMEPVGGPHNPRLDKALLLPVQTMPTIGDRLTEKGIAWAWYSGGWNEAETNTLQGDTFAFHHQPFAFFERFQKGRPERARHLKDLTDFLADIDKGTLPAVAFYKPRRGINQHPSGSSVEASDAHVGEILDRLEKSPRWGRMAVIVTYDENGGFWDHVAPPARDRWGPGARVPTLVISPFAKKGFVDSTRYDTTSILKLIETRFGLAPLGTADAAANDLTHAFQF